MEIYSEQSTNNKSADDMLCIETLSPNTIVNYMENICLIDSSSDFELEEWNIYNFLHDLPEKWKLSKFAFYKKQLIGYVICSKKNENNVHIHRFIVLKNNQNLGIGSKLLMHIIKTVPDGTCITLKVKKKNLKAITFYEKKGFVKFAEEDVNYLYKKIV
ncbi:GNAT family N-acetyltransferase [Methanolobus sediminis]|uniref:GNAT family N-acetyltransferase n=1 Tax=Methanolobus sediminis TaxID=3072978 RepID=A0AA51YJD0_9EURY|nr:GNAT family N-acetyltransferase [Methanolobus sediminis]WMW25435.1 GNAT family N-acetyltransferase [Methanolobus sediminis]